jgi:hypothetical protein
MNETMDPLTGREKVGCPSSQEWCRYTPRMTVLQFVIGYSFTTIGYPLGVTLIQTIFSKVLGPRPQGVWMGLMTGAGCASRVLGPVFVGLIYTRLGIYQTFGITGLTLLVSMLWLGLMTERLVPYSTSPEVDVSRDNKKPPSAAEIPLVRMPPQPRSDELHQREEDVEQDDEKGEEKDDEEGKEMRQKEARTYARHPDFLPKGSDASCRPLSPVWHPHFPNTCECFSSCASSIPVAREQLEASGIFL